METKEVKTKDGVIVEETWIETVAMILANCSESRMEDLDVKEKFMDYARRFIATLTEEELSDFVAHHVVIMLINRYL